MLVYSTAGAGDAAGAQIQSVRRRSTGLPYTGLTFVSAAAAAADSSFSATAGSWWFSAGSGSSGGGSSRMRREDERELVVHQLEQDVLRCGACGERVT